MITITWIIATLTIASLLIGVIAMIVVKIDPIPKWKTVGKIFIWVIGLIIFKFIVWSLINFHNDKSTPFTTAKSEIPSVQPAEEWVLTWSLPPGEYDRGLNSNTLEVRIIKNDSESLWFDTPYKYRGVTEVSRYLLSKSGDQFAGVWSQEQPKDAGSIYMRKVGNQIWIGQMTDRSGRPCACALKRK